MKHPFKYKTLDQILIDKGYLDAQSLTDVITGLAGHSTRLGNALLEQNFITSDQLAIALAEAFDVQLVDVSGFIVPPALFEVLPAAYAYQYQVLPYALGDDGLSVVVGHHFTSSLVDELEHLTGKKIKL
ncbi:MAG: hypothetical protein OEY07_18805, partial [Gammaproteobacteria bacterium]|nr:hypothetical protein [Gammaproteobacteria bacterium]